MAFTKNGRCNEDFELHRYMDFTKLVSLLDSSSLFFTRLSCFEDHLEGSLTHHHILLETKVVDRWYHFANYTLPHSFVAKKESQRTETPIIKDPPEHFINTVFGDFPVKQTDARDLFKRHREWLDVSCWHAGSSESMAMWKIYGGSVDAVCVISSTDSLARSICADPKYQLFLTDVHYIAHEEDSFQSSDPLAPYFHKHHFYSFEKEVRLISYDPRDNVFGDRPECERGTIHKVNLHELITKVVVAPQAPGWFFDLVCTLVKDKYGLKVDVTRSKMNQPPIY
ncbi:DUF2971 domain-containing protein [Rheinheimera soli]|uniref:DUF2971 domain-containing protein n=1 Tax=Rheinheimera soli TaxID=443616 RepID=UPI001E5E62B0|nr:DUF2971 domain-containing protein [Rheinheimera soli]